MGPESDDDNVRLHCAHCDFVTSKRDLFELVDHANEKHPDETFLCDGRTHHNGKRICWQKEPNGDRTCTYCGSLHEVELIDILTHYADGDEGYHFDPSTKGYKLYGHRPGVQNAMQGGIKFYKWHIDKTHPDFPRREAIFKRAMERFLGRRAADDDAT